FLQNHWKVSPDECIKAGVKTRDSVGSKTGTTKFTLWHVYLFAIRERSLTKEEADGKAVEEKDRTPGLRKGFQKYQSGAYSRGGWDGYYGFECCYH
ncbi:hypothetical protein K458DRAFT_313928, partial [Lentithecium fluviatile CBS 122367]